jgi:hypothetical protein
MSFSVPEKSPDRPTMIVRPIPPSKQQTKPTATSSSTIIFSSSENSCSEETIENFSNSSNSGELAISSVFSLAKKDDGGDPDDPLVDSVDLTAILGAKKQGNIKNILQMQVKTISIHKKLALVLGTKDNQH